jgi:hypothetical protein
VRIVADAKALHGGVQACPAATASTRE